MTQAKDTNKVNAPLRIDAVAVPGTGGMIGMAFCPGKKDPYSLSGPWDRDLEADFRAISSWGAKALVTLLEDFEFELLKVPDLPEAAQRHGLKWFHLPIVDAGIPEDDFEAAWQTFGPALREILRQGGNIVIHCRGGLGRTGIIAARLLVEFGLEPKEALEAVRKARPGAVQNVLQEEYVLRCRREL